MINGLKVVVVMPAYNAARTLAKTCLGLRGQGFDEVLLVDDASTDETVRIARELGLATHRHETNRGYGANQKTCYRLALNRGAEVVVMVHPDNQYEPRLASALAALVASGVYDCALGSRFIGGGARAGSMPLYKLIANRALTFIQNRALGAELSEYHTGFRAFSREVLLNLPLLENSDGFIFDNQILTQAVLFGYRIGELGSPTNYADEASSLGFGASCEYGLGVLRTTSQAAFQRLGLARSRFLNPDGRRLAVEAPEQSSGESGPGLSPVALGLD